MANRRRTLAELDAADFASTQLADEIIAAAPAPPRKQSTAKPASQRFSREFPSTAPVPAASRAVRRGVSDSDDTDTGYASWGRENIRPESGSDRELVSTARPRVASADVRAATPPVVASKRGPAVLDSATDLSAHGTTRVGGTIVGRKRLHPVRCAQLGTDADDDVIDLTL